PTSCLRLAGARRPGNQRQTAAKDSLAPLVTASDNCSEEAIHLVQIGASTQVASLNKQRCEVRKFLRELVTIQRSESGIPGQNSFNCLLIFLGFERTGRIHQATAIREHRKAVLEHCTLRLLKTR